MRKIINSHPLAVFADFRKLFVGRLVSAIGDKFFSMAIAWWVISKTGEGAKMQLGLVMAVNVIPVVLFGPPLGALVDRSDKRKVMLWADAVRAACVFILAWLLYDNSLTIPALYALCFVIASFAPLFESSTASSILRLTSAEKLASATAADASAQQLSSVAGSALGSILMAVAGVAGAFLFNAFSYLVSFVAVFFIKTNLRPVEGLAGSGYMADFKAGFAYIFSNRPLASLLLVFALFNFFLAPILIIIPMLVQFNLHETVVWLAVFETFFALGSAATSLWASFRTSYKNIYGTFFLSVLFLGLAFGGLAFTVNKALLCLLLLAAGSAMGAGNAAALTLLQETVAEEMKGRFFAVLTTICMGVLPLSFMVNGMLAERFSVNFTISLNALAVLAVSFIILLIPRVQQKTTDIS